MSTSISKTLPAYKRIVGPETPIPSGQGNFQNFSAPTYDGKTIVFFGKNEGYKGLYVTPDSSDSLARICDNHTALPGIQGAPADKNAYVENVSGFLVNDHQNPNPVLCKNGVAFFAANWAANLQGIFAYDFQSQSVRALTGTWTDAYFAGGQFSQPTVSRNGAVYLAAQRQTNTEHPQGAPGFYTIPFSGGDVKQVLDITKVTQPQFVSIGSAQVVEVDPENLLFFYAMIAPSYLPNEGIYAYGRNGVRTMIQSGQKIGPQTIPEGAGNMWQVISASITMVAAQTQVKPEDSPCVWSMQSFQEPGIIEKIAIGEFPDFNGNEFGTPPVTDGKRVVFTGCNGGDLGNVGLYVWNNESKKVTKVLEAYVDELDGRTFMNAYLTNSCFVNGKLAAQVLLGEKPQDQIETIYLFDLSSY